jgi:hypothetical protein
MRYDVEYRGYISLVLVLFCLAWLAFGLLIVATATSYVTNLFARIVIYAVIGTIVYIAFVFYKKARIVKRRLNVLRRILSLPPENISFLSVQKWGREHLEELIGKSVSFRRYKKTAYSHGPNDDWRSIQSFLEDKDHLLEKDANDLREALVALGFIANGEYFAFYDEVDKRLKSEQRTEIIR